MDGQMPELIVFGFRLLQKGNLVASLWVMILQIILTLENLCNTGQLRPGLAQEKNWKISLKLPMLMALK